MYKVLMFNDGYTPMEFLVRVLERFFAKAPKTRWRIMLHVHHRGIGVWACSPTSDGSGAPASAPAAVHERGTQDHQRAGPMAAPVHKSRHFRMVFLAIVTLTMCCGLAASAIALWGPDPLTPALQKVFENMLSLFSVGSGAIFGLFGGRVGSG